MGSGEIFSMAALSLSCIGANWLSTMMMPSEPTATVTLPPAPCSMYVLLPRSVVFTSTLEKSMFCCASAVPTNSAVVAASAASMFLDILDLLLW